MYSGLISSFSSFFRKGEPSAVINIIDLSEQFERAYGPLTPEQRDSCESINISELLRAYEQKGLEILTAGVGR